MLDQLFFICLIIAVVAAATRIGIATAAPLARPRRIQWDDPADADG
jgi:hypothetical protein